MDAPAGTPFTPSYTRDPSTVAVADAANPSAGSLGFASAGAPPSIGVARGLFMPPRMTSVVGGLASAPAVNPRGPLSKLRNAVRPKKGKVSVKKNKAADGSDSSKPPRKKLMEDQTSHMSASGTSPYTALNSEKDSNDGQ
ncbi:hypothetical protein D1007_21414 [Hordeum vulgare]|nr:hypothetical protein D1007_21414 [Hordeum vulgare]